MDMPVEDGFIILTMTHPIVRRASTDGQLAEDYYIRFDFKDIDNVVLSTHGIQINCEGRIFNYPWANIVEHHHELNSKKYLSELNAYQYQHDHNWVCSGDYLVADNPPGFLWYCGPNRTGSDPGCKASERRQLDDQGRTIKQVQDELKELGETMQILDDEDD